MQLLQKQVLGLLPGARDAVADPASALPGTLTVLGWVTTSRMAPIQQGWGQSTYVPTNTHPHTACLTLGKGQRAARALFSHQEGTTIGDGLP